MNAPALLMLLDEFLEKIDLIGCQLAKYSPDQPRVPSGTSAGGQWTDGGGSQEQSEGSLSERTAQNYRGIKNVSFAPSEITDQKVIKENKSYPTLTS